MTDEQDDPTRDPQLAEAWRAFSQLLSAADEPVDASVLAPRIAHELGRRARRRWRVAAGASVGALAVAASLVAAAFFWSSPAAEQIAAVPAQQAADSQIAEDEKTMEIPAWDDEFDNATVALAAEIEATAERWRQPPDSFAALRQQVDQFEQELQDNSL